MKAHLVVDPVVEDLLGEDGVHPVHRQHQAGLLPSLGAAGHHQDYEHGDHEDHDHYHHHPHLLHGGLRLTERPAVYGGGEGPGYPVLHILGGIR